MQRDCVRACLNSILYFALDSFQRGTESLWPVVKLLLQFNYDNSGTTLENHPKYSCFLKNLVFTMEVSRCSKATLSLSLRVSFSPMISKLYWPTLKGCCKDYKIWYANIDQRDFTYYSARHKTYSHIDYLSFVPTLLELKLASQQSVQKYTLSLWSQLSENMLELEALSC